MRPWLYAQNPFLNATEGNFHLARQISIFHINALNAAKADPEILALYNDYLPIHEDIMTKYSEWKKQLGIQQRDTDVLAKLLVTLRSDKIKDWDIKVQSVYKLESSEYKGLLPNRRGPFQTGEQDDRIGAVREFILAIGTNESLATLKADVQAYYTKLDNASTTQKTSKSATVDFSQALEGSRFRTSVGQFGDLGLLIKKYPTSPESIEKFFDLESIRYSSQTEFNGTLAPGETQFIAKRSFGETDEILLKNTGDSKLRFYLAQTKELGPGPVFVEMNKGEQTIVATALGDVENTYLKVLNTDGVVTGSYTIKIL